jgi:hypothetical protein
MRRPPPGSIALEGALALSLLVPATLLGVEWARRGIVDVALASASCAVARDARWGVPVRRAFLRARPLFDAALGPDGTAALHRRSAPVITPWGRGRRARLSVRRPLLWRFPFPSASAGTERHHFEVTHRCLSP